MNFDKSSRTQTSLSVLTLLTGTGIAQAILISVSPILTRIYSPEDFGTFATYSAIVAILAVISTGRYELAIVSPKKETDAANVVVLCLSISVVLSILSYLLIQTFGYSLVKALGNSEIQELLYLLPISLLLTGFYQTLNYWNTRKEVYKNIASSSVAISGSSATMQIILGIGVSQPNGLVVGSVSGQGVGAFSLYMLSRTEFLNSIRNSSIHGILKNAKRYKDFPLFSSGASLINNIATQLPVFVITSAFGVTVTGIYSLTIRILSAPLTLFSSAIFQVFFKKITTISIEKPEDLQKYVLNTFLLLVLFGSPLVALMIFWGPMIFSIVFGDEWVEAGEIAGLLSIVAVVRFAISPLSAVFSLENNVKRGAFWQLLYFVSLASLFYFIYDLDFNFFLMLYVIHEVILYGVFLFLILRSSKHRKYMTN
ncbi:MAG: oligosaccharide flippase family protein [Pseudomonadales bacterium]|nr:oligosaccharide flippase family protein [Pseudomonadales bacterium]